MTEKDTGQLLFNLFHRSLFLDINYKPFKIVKQHTIVDRPFVFH